MSKAFKTKYLFKKYLNNTCSAVELEELFELLKDESNLKIVESDLEMLWQDTKKKESTEQSDRYEKFKSRINSEKKNYRYTSLKKINYKWAIAASIFFGLILTSYYFYSQTDSLQKNVLLENNALNKLNPSVKRIVLDDGSVVILNKGSYLNYPAKFIGKNREVYLIGEAYFDIEHDEKRPFLVHTGNLVTRVLGTAFNIKNGAEKSLIEVTVSRGKVAVINSKKTLAILLPNQKISYNQQSGNYHKEKANANAATLWKEQDLVLDNLTLQQAAKKIGERYATNILLDNDKIMNCRFTAYFLNTTDLKQVIKVITSLNHLNYSINDKGVYTLSGNGCD